VNSGHFQAVNGEKQSGVEPPHSKK